MTEDCRFFGQKYCLHLQCRRLNHVSENKLTEGRVSPVFLLVYVIFYHDNGSTKFR
jgi:hypothetical protein